MAKRTPPFKEHPDWSTARFWSFIRSALRMAWNKWPPKYTLLQENRRVVTGKRHKYEYQCCECQGWFKAKEVEVDHKIPCGSLKCYEDLPGFVERMFVGPESLRVVCRECHKRITNEAKAFKK